jgi:UDP-glucose 4-epimerase
MNVFVTGSSGYLGSILIRHLAMLPEVDAITGIDLAPPLKPMPSKAVFKQLDIRDPDLSTAMAGHDVVVHLACVVMWPYKMPKAVLEDINVNGARNAAKAAVASRAKRFIQVSSIAAYAMDDLKGQSSVPEDAPLGDGRSNFYYSNTKVQCERALTEIIDPSETQLTIFRPSIVIGERVDELVGFLRTHSVRIRRHNPRVQLVHEDDVVSAIVQAVLTDMPGAYNVVPDDALRWNEILQIVGRRKPPAISLLLACVSVGFGWRFLRSPMHSSWVKALCKDFTLSNTKLKATGWIPRHSSEGDLTAASRETATNPPLAASSSRKSVEAIEST